MLQKEKRKKSGKNRVGRKFLLFLFLFKKIIVILILCTLVCI